MVPKKGKHVYALTEMSKLIGWVGSRRVILKTDREPAIMELKECVKFEESPTYDSRANGEVERAIQTVQGQVRAVKDAFEARYGYELKPEDNLIPWMVAHSDIFVLNSTAQRYAVSIAVNIASCCSRLERGCTWMAMFGEHASQRDSFHSTEPVYIFVLSTSVVCISRPS